MKTVLHFIDTTGPGGAETIFVELAGALDPTRFRSVAAVVGPGWVADQLAVRRIPTHSVAPWRQGPRLFGELTRVARSSGASIIQSHLTGAGLYGALVGRRVGTPAVVTFHGQADLRAGDWKRWLRFRLLGAAASRVVFVSEALRDYVLARTPLDRRKTAVIPNGVPMERFAPGRERDIRAELGIGDGETVVGALGNVRASKGYDVLLQAAARLPRDLPWRVVVVGEGEPTLSPELERLRCGLGLQDRVHFVGFRPDPAVALRNFDVFVLPSRHEGFSLATVQAMATGLPIVATRSGGPSEILAEGGGTLVDPEEPGPLAAEIENLVRSADRRASLGSGARVLAARFSVDRMSRAYQDLYDSL